MNTWDPRQEAEADVWIGKAPDEWVVHLFVTEIHAITWAGGGQGRDIWKAHVSLGEELEYVPPGAARLRSRIGGEA